MIADSDFVYAIQSARNLGVMTQLCHSGETPVNQSLPNVVDGSMLLTQKIIDKCRQSQIRCSEVGCLFAGGSGPGR